MMIRRKAGFTLIELLIVVAILGLVLAATSDMFVGLLRGYKQQSKIAETNIEGVIGLELLRQDIERAGYGLPWVVPVGLAYNEASAAGYNDAPPNPPRPILSDNNYASGLNNSDLLVIKATNLPRSRASQLWTYQTSGAGPKSWPTTSTEDQNLAGGNYAIVLSPGTGNYDTRTLVTANTVSLIPWPAASDPQPQFVYGIDNGPPAGGYNFPFNRADYYIPATSNNVPNRCAPNTGVLVKSIISHSNGARTDVLPLLDCVADMKVIFRLDRTGNGVLQATDTLTDPSGVQLTAEQIREQVKEVRVYILAHEGQKDTSYTHPTSTIYVGDSNSLMDNSLGHSFNIGANVNYRWKLYTIVVQPKNMKQELGAPW